MDFKIAGDKAIAEKYLNGDFNFKKEKVSKLEVILLTKVCDVRKYHDKIVIVGDMSKENNYPSILQQYKHNLIDRENGIVLLTDDLDSIPKKIELEKEINKCIYLLNHEVKIEIRLTHKMCKDFRSLEEKPMYCLGITGCYKGSYGQCLDHIQEDRYLMNETDRVIWDKIYDIWRRWHLNNVKSGTETQIEKAKGLNSYNEITSYLAFNGLLIDRGYRYGSGWLCEELPFEVVNLIKMI